MLIIENETRLSIDSSFLEKIAQSLSTKDIECVFIDSEDMQELNLNSRGVDKSTDVLSFPLEDIPFAPLGSIVINAQMADEISKKFGHKFEDEISLLFIHGLLHLLGLDHEVDNGDMRARERELIEKFNLPKSLIDRTFDEN